MEKQVNQSNHNILNYLNKLIIHNFQSHKNSSIELAPPGQLTVIVGPSDNGKTAIIRALKLLAYNSPQGMDYIRVGENECTVQGVMSDGGKVTRQRTRGGVNRYILEPTGQQRQVYEGFGISVPLEVRQMLGMTPISIGDTEINLNLSEQLDGPFLGNAVPVTAKAKVLGKLSGVEEVDHANKTIGTDLYRMRREEEGAKATIKSLAEQIEAYGYLDEMGITIGVIEQSYAKLAAKITRKEALLRLQLQLTALYTAIEQERRKICKLQFVDTMQIMLVKTEVNCGKYDQFARLVNELERTQEELDRVQAITDKAHSITLAFELLIKADGNAKRAEQLRRLCEQSEAVQKSVNEAEVKIEGLEQFNMVQQKLAALEQKEARRADLQIKFNEAAKIPSRFVAVTGDIAAAATAIETTKERLVNVFKEAGKCPTCGTEFSGLNPEKLREVL